MVDTPGLGPGAARRGGSSPLIRTIKCLIQDLVPQGVEVSW
jgi:hypothetical protein